MVVLGAKYERGDAMLTPDELVLIFGVVICVPRLAKIDQETRS